PLPSGSAGSGTFSGTRSLAGLQRENSVRNARSPDPGGLLFPPGGPRESRFTRSGGGDAMSAMPGVVAINTFREAVRDRVLYNLIFFALMMMGAAIFVGQI